MRVILILLITICLLSSVVHAFSLEGENSATAPTESSRQLDLILKTDIKDSFSINLKGEKPWMTLSDTSVSLEKDESRIISLYISPFKKTMLGTYKVTVTAKSLSTGEKQEKSLFISVVKGDVLEIEKIVVKGDLKPTGKIGLEIYIKNFRTTTATNIHADISVDSTYELLSFSESIPRLDPDETIVITRQFSLNKYAPPGKYFVNAKLIENGDTASIVKQDFSVVKGPVMDVNRELGLTFIGFTKKITATNNGNDIASSYGLTETIEGMDKTFYFGQKPDNTDGNRYNWIFYNIEPGSFVVVTYSINYLPLIVLIIILIAFIWFIIFKLHTLRIKKYIMQKKVIKEGAEFTIGVEINNALRDKTKDIIITDFVPSVFSVKDAYGPASKKKKKGIGTQLTWNIKELKSGEERILSYKIIPIFGLQGTVKLPSASVKFKYKKKPFKNKSWPATIGIRHQKDE